MKYSPQLFSINSHQKVFHSNCALRLRGLKRSERLTAVVVVQFPLFQLLPAGFQSRVYVQLFIQMHSKKFSMGH